MKIIIHAYEYVFYRIYKVAYFTERYVRPNSGAPELIATYFMIVLLGSNTFGILGMYSSLSGNYVQLSIFHVFAFILIAILINYLLLLRNDRIFKIVKKFDSDSKRQRNVKIVFFLIYLALTFGLIQLAVSLRKF